MPGPLVPSLHCCWVIDPWNPKRDSITQAWGERFNIPVTLWHAGQLGDHVPQGNVVLRHISELLESDTSQQLQFKVACEYELQHRSHACCADLLRYMVVYTHGGLYFDLDVTPHSRIADNFLPLLQEPDTLVLDRSYRSCEIRVVCAVNPGNADLLRVLKEALRRHAIFRAEGGYAHHGYSVKEIIYRTGPTLMHEVLLLDLKASANSWTMWGPGPDYIKRLEKHTATRVIRHTDFRKTEHVMSSHDRVLAIARGASQ
jgi:hypothetical protein